MAATDAAIAARRTLGSDARSARARTPTCGHGAGYRTLFRTSVRRRQVRRCPQLASTVVLTLVIGIGLNSVAFSAFNGLLFRAQVSRDPASFVQTFSFVTGDRDRQWHGTPTKGTLELYDAFRADAQTLSAVTAGQWTTFRIRDAEFSTTSRQVRVLQLHIGAQGAHASWTRICRK